MLYTERLADLFCYDRIEPLVPKLQIDQYSHGSEAIRLLPSLRSAYNLCIRILCMDMDFADLIRIRLGQAPLKLVNRHKLSLKVESCRVR